MTVWHEEDAHVRFRQVLNFMVTGCSHRAGPRVPKLQRRSQRRSKQNYFSRSTIQPRSILKVATCSECSFYLLCRCKHPNNQRFTLLTAMNWYTPGSQNDLGKSNAPGPGQRSFLQRWLCCM